MAHFASLISIEHVEHYVNYFGFFISGNFQRETCGLWMYLGHQLLRFRYHTWTIKTNRPWQHN